MGCTMGTWAGTELEEQLKVTSVMMSTKEKAFFSFFLEKKTQNTGYKQILAQPCRDQPSVLLQGSSLTAGLGWQVPAL